MRNIGIDEARIVVVGYSKRAFVAELLRQPEFGFVTLEEVSEIDRLRNSYNSGAIPRDEYVKYVSGIKRRITNQWRGGYVMFIGFKELSADLFKMTKDSSESGLPGTIDGIMSLVESGAIKINENLLRQFEYSFVIVDEFHKLYSSVEINTYGLALKFILDFFQVNDRYKHLGLFTPESYIRVALLSATPLSHKPGEVVDMLNILIPGADYKPSDIFESGKLTQNSLNKLRSLIRGRVSYVRNVNEKLFPERIFVGEHIKGIKYLRFIRTDVSKEHKNLLSQYPKLSIEEFPLMDYILPVPGPDSTLQYSFNWSTATQLYEENPEFLTKHNLKIVNETISGVDLSICSGKYKSMIEYVKKAEDKILIYHNNIRGSGVLFIAQLLRDIGYAEYGTDVLPDTICLICKKIFDTHTAESHMFVASRFMVVHGELRKNIINDMLDMYNASNNTYGHKCQVCIGSRMITESLNFKSVRNLYIMTYPGSIANLLQIFGRPDRMYSHIELPVMKRNILMLIFVSSYKSDTMTQEEDKYKNAMKEYLDIQKIDKIMHETAVDSALNYNLIRKDMKEDKNTLSLNYYVPETVLPDNVDDTSFYKYFIPDEIREVIYIVKIIFIRYSKIWKLSDLWNFMHIVDVDLELDPEYLVYDSFIIAIHELINAPYIPHLTELDPEFSISGINHRIINIRKDEEDYLMAIPSEISINELGSELDVSSSTFSYDSWYRNAPSITNKNINITEYVQGHSISLDRMRYVYLENNSNATMYNIISSLNEYSLEFHIYMIQYCVRYLFNILTNVSMNLIENHYSLMKLYYVYTSFGYILFASDIINTEFYNLFREYITDDISILDKDQIEIAQIPDTYDRLLRTYSKNLVDKTNISFENINKVISSSSRQPMSSIHDIQFAKGDIHQVPAYILPVGYSICTKIRYEYSIYNIKNEEASLDPWMFKYEPLFSVPYRKENNLIIGYDIDNDRRLERQFKLRTPIGDNYTDKRLLNKGMACSSYKKDRLEAISKQLKISITSEKNADLCENIRKELIRREIESRKKESGEKWYYVSFEHNPLRH